ncbi:prepilin-type N-terminal cleavage/methylation domain-containing protein [bacterium]|nr:prepilin-type N-terminal cleavage/methylation domain-containing protein [bacterium]MBU1882674.1 prepilin-type N-terminal cleavage/methylation domain-containing protein [bacterium]
MRNAFTMIELIFAIVVIAISILSLPMMMRVNQNAMEANVVQEALFASSAKIMQVLSYPWDQHSQDNSNLGAYTKIVSLGAGDNYPRTYDMYVNADGNGSFRAGAIIADGHRRFHNYLSADANITTILGTGSTEALSNIAENNITFINEASSATGYKDKYKMDVDVSYVTDVDVGGTFIFPADGNTTATNMKLITVTIKDKDGEILTLLRSYSANIGEIDFAKRRF